MNTGKKSNSKKSSNRTAIQKTENVTQNAVHVGKATSSEDVPRKSISDSASGLKTDNTPSKQTKKETRKKNIHNIESEEKQESSAENQKSVRDFSDSVIAKNVKKTRRNRKAVSAMDEINIAHSADSDNSGKKKNSDQFVSISKKRSHGSMGKEVSKQGKKTIQERISLPTQETVTEKSEMKTSTRRLKNKSNKQKTLPAVEGADFNLLSDVDIKQKTIEELMSKISELQEILTQKMGQMQAPALDSSLPILTNVQKSERKNVSSATAPIEKTKRRTKKVQLNEKKQTEAVQTDQHIAKRRNVRKNISEVEQLESSITETKIENISPEIDVLPKGKSNRKKTKKSIEEIAAAIEVPAVDDTVPVTKYSLSKKRKSSASNGSESISSDVAVEKDLKTQEGTFATDEFEQVISVKPQKKRGRKPKSAILNENNHELNRTAGKTEKESMSSDSRPVSVSDKKNTKPLKHTNLTKNDTMKQYMGEIGEIPLVTKEQEIELASQIHGDDYEAQEKARDTLIKANLRLVVKIAHDFKGLGLPLLDLISEGNLGLMRAVMKFDPDKGAKFSSYAAWWIKQSMRRALANQSKTIRIPVQSAGKINKIKSTRVKLAEELGREPTDTEIATTLEFSERTVSGLRLADLRTFSLHDPIQQGEEGEFQDIIPDRSAMTPDHILGDEESKNRLKQILDDLDEREQQIIKMRFGLDYNDGQGMTLEEVSQRIGRTRERVRQIQNQALAKLRNMLSDEAGFNND